MKKETNVIYSDHFIEVVNFAHEHTLFVGTGNPNSDILIIGKEAAISMETNEAQYNREMKENANDWIQNIAQKTQLKEVDSWLNQENPVYNPLFPYKNQLNKVLSRNKLNEIVRGAGGTSKTWYNYQKMMTLIYNNGLHNSTINFHEHSFSTELNQMTGKYSKDVDLNERKESIKKRAELLAFPFFQTFPITIVAVGHYVRDFNINLEQQFNVTFDEAGSKELSKGMGKDFINVHYGQTGNQKRMLIHTNQLSMVSTELINRLSILCNSFLCSNELHGSIGPLI